MRSRLLLIFLIASLGSFSQETFVILKPDTLLPFNGRKSLRLHGFENRVVPYNSYYPLYVLISYSGTSATHFEYFRIDSSKYLMNEFFRSKKGSSNDGLKASGVVRVVDKILDSSFSGSRSASGDGGSKQTHYYKGFSKEGVWEEYEDSVFSHRFWTGNYLNNKRVGLWSNFVYDPNDDRLIQQIDYDSDSTKKIYLANIVGQLSLDSIGFYLLGRWPIGYDPSEDTRNLMMKCQLYDGHYGDDCNGKYDKISYYEFFEKGKFVGQNEATNNRKNTYPTSGSWKISRVKDKVILEITASDRAKLRYEVLYLDREGNMVADKL